MDRRDFDKLHKINKSIPREYIKNLITKEKPFSADAEIAREMSKNKNLDKDTRRKLYEMSESDSQEVQRVNPKYAKKIEDYVTRKMEREIKSGRLTPKKDSWDKRLSE